MVIVRPEQPEDIEARRSVTAQACGRSAEAHLREALRTRGQVLRSLVVERDTQMVGHCLCSPVRIEAGGHGCAIVGLGPMAVLPALQRQGIGTLLVQDGLARCRHADYDGVVVLGHPTYYPRFGFVPASLYGIRCAYHVPDDVLMALALRGGALPGCAGTAQYPPECNAVCTSEGQRGHEHEACLPWPTPVCSPRQGAQRAFSQAGAGGRQPGERGSRTRAAPNKGVQATAYSLRSFVAPAFGGA